jgi:hypothetical protein
MAIGTTILILGAFALMGGGEKKPTSKPPVSGGGGGGGGTPVPPAEPVKPNATLNTQESPVTKEGGDPVLIIVQRSLNILKVRDENNMPLIENGMWDWPTQSALAIYLTRKGQAMPPDNAPTAWRTLAKMLAYEASRVVAAGSAGGNLR